MLRKSGNPFPLTTCAIPRFLSAFLFRRNGTCFSERNEVSDMIKVLALTTLAFAALLAAQSGSAKAADLPVITTPRHSERTVIHQRRVVVRSRVPIKLIGMPCVLRPHVVVSRLWNGPQCRYVDN